MPTESQAQGSWCGHADLIAFLQALPEGRKRRGVRYPQWLLLLMAILGILSGCGSARDLERFAKRHHHAFGAALDLELPKAPLGFLPLLRCEPPGSLEVRQNSLPEPVLASPAMPASPGCHAPERPAPR